MQHMMGADASTRTFSDDSFRSWGHPPRQSVESSAGTSSLGSREGLLEGLNVPGYRRGVPNLPPIRRPNIPRPNIPQPIIPAGVKARLKGVGKTVKGGLK